MQEILVSCKKCNVIPELQPKWVAISNNNVVGAVLMKVYVCPNCKKESKPDHDIPKTIKQWNEEQR